MWLENGEFQKIVLEQLQRLSEGQDQLGNRLDSVEEGQKRLESRLNGVEESQLRLEARLEHEIMEKIVVLFDDREVQNDRFENLEKRMEHLENQVEGIAIDVRYLVTRVIRLEKAAK